MHFQDSREKIEIEIKKLNFKVNERDKKELQRLKN